MNTREIAFFDLDGVLANDSHRVDHALAHRWAEYFDPKAVAADPVWPQGVAAVAAAQERGAEIFYMTGRRETLRFVTEPWLERNGFPKGMLFMRPLGVSTRLAELKAQMLESYQDLYPSVRVVLYDDDPEVVRVVQERLGSEAAVHCTWHIKQKALVRTATS